MKNTFAANQSNIEEIFNEENFSGAIMGMGLSKSYQQGSKKICIYNTINGQDKLVFNNNKVECPVEYPERKKNNCFHYYFATNLAFFSLKTYYIPHHLELIQAYR